jgi:hypothetical protein
MRLIGMLTTVVGATAVAALAVVGIRAIPDIKRYLKIRQM